MNPEEFGSAAAALAMREPPEGWRAHILCLDQELWPDRIVGLLLFAGPLPGDAVEWVGPEWHTHLVEVRDPSSPASRRPFGEGLLVSEAEVDAEKRARIAKAFGDALSRRGIAPWQVERREASGWN